LRPPRDAKHYLDALRAPDSPRNVKPKQRTPKRVLQPELPADFAHTKPVLCPECYGRGVDRKGKNCVRCKGKGVVPQEPGKSD
jgi:hypothetical protein